MEQSEQINELAKALVAVQKVLRPALKDSKNPHFNSKYADLESVMDTIREPLADHDLVVTQTMEPAPDGVTVVTTLLHTSGQWLRSKCYLKPQRNDPQGIGSCITYGRRYGAAAIVGLHQTDDDGEAASGRGGAGGSPAALTRPGRLSERALPPETPAANPNVGKPLTLTGEDDPLLTDTQRKKLFALVGEYDVSTEDFRALCLEKWGIKSRAELRASMLAPLVEWIKAHKRKAVA